MVFSRLSFRNFQVAFGPEVLQGMLVVKYADLHALITYYPMTYVAVVISELVYNIFCRSSNLFLCLIVCLSFFHFWDGREVTPSHEGLLPTTALGA